MKGVDKLDPVSREMFDKEGSSVDRPVIKGSTAVGTLDEFLESADSVGTLVVGLEGSDPCPLILNNKTYFLSEEPFAGHLNRNPQTNLSVVAESDSVGTLVVGL